MFVRRLKAARNAILFQAYSSRDAVYFFGRGRMHVDPDDKRGRKVLLCNGVTRLRNSWLWRAAANKMDPDLALDIGANYGEIASSSAYPRDCDVVLVEANGALVPLLEKTKASRNDRANWHIVSCGASDHDGKMKFVVAHHTGESRLASDDEANAGECVDVVRLDGLPQCTNKKRILFKIDVEGEEVRALNGLQSVLKNADSYLGIIELSSENLQRSGFAPHDLWNRVRELGQVALFDDEERLVDCSALDWPALLEEAHSSALMHDHGADLVMYHGVNEISSFAPPLWLNRIGMILRSSLGSVT